MSDASADSGQSRPLFTTLLASGPSRPDPVDISTTVAAVGFHFLLVLLFVWLVPVPTPPSGILGAAATHALMLTDLYWATPRPGEAAKHSPLRKENRPVKRPLAAPDIHLPNYENIAQQESSASASEWLNQPDMELRRALDDLVGAMGSSANGTGSKSSESIGAGYTIEELKIGPRLTPYTVGPQLLNRQEIADTLQQRYPLHLRQMGAGGLSTLWLLIDEHGKARKALLFTSSGRAAFDAMALEVVSIMRFSPAQNTGVSTAVWVQLPVRFRVEDVW